MDDVNIAQAKERLEELLDRAARGDTVRITGTKHGVVQLGVTTFVRHPIKLGLMAGRAVIKDEDLFAPLTEDELSWLSGKQSP